jgi:hypothetical protein
MGRNTTTRSKYATVRSGPDPETGGKAQDVTREEKRFQQQ